MTSKETTMGIGKILANAQDEAAKSGLDRVRKPISGLARPEELPSQDVSFSEEVGDGHPNGSVGNPFGSRSAVPDTLGSGGLNAYLAARNKEAPKGGDNDLLDGDRPAGSSLIGERGGS